MLKCTNSSIHTAPKHLVLTLAEHLVTAVLIFRFLIVIWPLRQYKTNNFHNKHIKISVGTYSTI